jgi:hypothetical protein
MFQKATRQQSRLRMTIDGPAGSGKTYTALRFAHTLGGRIAVIDTERGSASKYVGDSPDGTPWDFDVMNLTTFSPEKYTEAILMAAKAQYSVLVIDSLSHAWEGVGGALEIKQRAGESWSAWRHVTPIHNRMVDAMLQAPMHVITTMRSRMEYVQEVDQTTGRTVIRKVGLSPIQRPGFEYEFDIVADMDWSHILTVSKSRCSAVADRVTERPGPEFMRPVIEWLESGAAVMETFTAPMEAEGAHTSVVSLDDLVAQYGVEQIMAANGGTIPGTQEELDLIAGLLQMSGVES